MLLDLSQATKLSDNLYDSLIDNDLLISRISDDFPLPWDADIEINNNTLVLTGHAGSSGYGTAEVSIPLKDVNKYLRIEIANDTDPELIADLVHNDNILILDESKKVTIKEDSGIDFNDKYFPRVDITDTTTYDIYDYKNHKFAYDKTKSLLIDLFQDEDEVTEMGDDAPWRELDAVGLSRDHWDHDRDEYLDEYISDQDNEAESLVQNFMEYEFDDYYKDVSESLELTEYEEPSDPIIIHGYASTWKITPTVDGKYNVMPGNKNYSSVSDAKKAIRIAEKRWSEANPNESARNRDIWFDHGIMITDDDIEGYFD